MIYPRRIKTGQRGFTIIELMIATTILSTMLILVTIIMISIGNLYYKGVNQARVQDDVRSITADVAANLQLNDSAPTIPNPNTNTISGVPVSAYCIGTTRYTYAIGVQIGHTAIGSPTLFNHVLWRDTVSSTSNCLPVSLNLVSPNNGTQPGTNGTELIAPNSRLITFSINPQTSPYTVSVGVAYGDSDLLCSTNPAVIPAGSCANPGAMTRLVDYSHGDLQCKGIKGDQFCSTAQLSTTVVLRLTDNSF